MRKKKVKKSERARPALREIDRETLSQVTGGWFCAGWYYIKPTRLPGGISEAMN
jgi:hypothetical protein